MEYEDNLFKKIKLKHHRVMQHTSTNSQKVNLCAICNDKVNGIHYSVRTCASCKGKKFSFILNFENVYFYKRFFQTNNSK